MNKPTFKNKNEQQTLLIYANSSAAIGGGHVMRQIALAQGAHKNGWQVVFIFRECSEAIIQRILDEGFSIFELTGTSLAEQVAVHNAHAIVIDDYYLTDIEQENIKQLPIPVVYFDDQIDQQPYLSSTIVNIDANIVVNSADNVTANDYLFTCAKTQLCLGAQYRIIRHQFLHKRLLLNDFSKRQRLLITLGDSDIKGLSLPLTQCLLEKDNNLTIDLVIGSMTNIDETQLRQLNSNYPHVNIHRNITDMSDLMSQAGMAITTAGGTLYELALLGVPAVALCIVDNQISALHSPMNGSGYLGYDLRNYDNQQQLVSLLQKTQQDITINRISLACIELWQQENQREAMSAKLQHAIDGLGSQRVITAIEQHLKNYNGK